MLVVAGLLLGTSMAWADSTALVGDTYDVSGWEGSPPDPSGVAYLGNGTYIVVDHNHNDPNGFNGWILDPDTGDDTNVDVGINGEDVTGVDYDPGSDRLFLSNDDGYIKVIHNFVASGDPGDGYEIDTGSLSSDDTEDPA
jgi:hypothetical protein